MKKYLVTKDGKTIVDDLGNAVAVCTWKNMARRIVKALNAKA
jgi:hypothetical protein